MNRIPGKKLFTIAAAAAAMLLAALPGQSQDLRDSRGPRGCTNGSLKGDFGFTAKGVTLSGSPLPGPLQGPFASSGTASFDGKGRFTLTAASSFNGLVQPTAVGGTYSVNRDCTYTSTAENGVTFQAVIVEEGREVLILQTTPGVVITGVAQAQGARRVSDDAYGWKQTRCNNFTINAAYGFLAEGQAGAPTLPPDMAGPLAGVGTVTFRPNGMFALTATRSVNGVLDSPALSLKGSYTVDWDCTLKMYFEVGFTFSGAIVDGGDEINLIETDPGTTLLVKARKM